MFLELTIFCAVFLSAEGSYSWYDYPGFELWKFVNLGLFIAAALYLHHVFGKPVSEALKSRKEQIRAQLLRAQEERDAALAQLAAVEARLKGLEKEVSAIREKAEAEAKAESERIRLATEAEVAKLKESSRREIEMAGKSAAVELRRFAAQQSIRMAEEIIRRDIKPEDELRLMRLPEQSLGGNH
jgi:F-type H+-transporting ATPase subunit b